MPEVVLVLEIDRFEKEPELVVERVSLLDVRHRERAHFGSQTRHSDRSLSTSIGFDT